MLEASPFALMLFIPFIAAIVPMIVSIMFDFFVYLIRQVWEMLTP